MRKVTCEFYLNFQASPTTVKNSIIFPASGVIFFIFREISREDAVEELSFYIFHLKKYLMLKISGLQTEFS